MARVLAQRWFPFCAIAVAAGLSTQSAEARRSGYQTTRCKSCHDDNVLDLAVEVRFTPDAPRPGETVLMSIEVSAPQARRAGIAIASNGLGEFEVGDAARLNHDGIWITHSEPHPLNDGAVTFEVQWRAPEEPSIADFSVAVVAANGNDAISGDGTTSEIVALPVGCDGTIELFRDADGDGFGDSQAPETFACAVAEGFVPEGGDCDDADDSIHPGAPEQCNDIDDDCDDAVDEDVTYRDYYNDSDQDGFGDPVVVIEACTLLAGTSDNDLDCNDFDAQIGPGAVELCDSRDNNCNGQVDEGCNTDASDTDASDTDASNTDASNTDAANTDAANTDAANTDAADTDASDTDETSDGSGAQSDNRVDSGAPRMNTDANTPGATATEPASPEQEREGAGEAPAPSRSSSCALRPTQRGPSWTGLAVLLGLATWLLGLATWRRRTQPSKAGAGASPRPRIAGCRDGP